MRNTVECAACKGAYNAAGNKPCPTCLEKTKEGKCLVAAKPVSRQSVSGSHSPKGVHPRGQGEDHGSVGANAETLHLQDHEGQG